MLSVETRPSNNFNSITKQQPLINRIALLKLLIFIKCTKPSHFQAKEGKRLAVLRAEQLAREIAANLARMAANRLARAELQARLDAQNNEQ